jgi:adenine deaminase
MKKISGNIFDFANSKFVRGHLFFDASILSIIEDNSVSDSCFILPGLIDSHVHIESSMLSPVEYSKAALKHGVIAAVTDPHEIANVCGVEGVKFMIENSKKTPMKIFTGVPSCVPATKFETSGFELGLAEVEQLLSDPDCSHLSEMMNFPGVIFDDPLVVSKLQFATRFNKRIDGHAPALSGDALKKYINAGISTDHESVSFEEAKEKILLGMKILIRESSASSDFDFLSDLIDIYPDSVMFCTDDCHPDDLERRYIDDLFRKSIQKGYSPLNIIKTSSINAIDHYSLTVGKLQIDDPSDFIVVDDLQNFNILKTFINGVEVYDGLNTSFNECNIVPINNFYSNVISISDIQVFKTHDCLNVIEVVENSLLTKRLIVQSSSSSKFWEQNTFDDILKVVVLNRYSQAKPTVGFIKGFGLKSGAISSSFAHDSHNIIAIGVDDLSILKSIEAIQKLEGGLAFVNDSFVEVLPLPIAGLMSDKTCSEVASIYKNLNSIVKNMGCSLKSPFMTMSFMSLLVIPELKIGDKGLFDVTKFGFIDLQF